MTDSSVEPRINPYTGKPEHPNQGRIDSEVDSALMCLFDELLSDFVYLSHRKRERGEKPMTPHELCDALRSWDLDEPFRDWWYGDSTTDGENEDGEKWDGETA